MITKMQYAYQNNGLVLGITGTKDHFVNESGTTHTYFYEIKKQ